MATNISVNTAVCSDCELSHISKPSSHWCSVCEEALCSECNDRHKLRKLTRGHTTIPIEHYHKLPKNISKIKQYCQEHDERFQMFCRVHDRAICSNCIKTHAKCTDNIVPLSDIISNTKTSEAFNDVITSLADLKENIKKIQEGKEQNINSIKEQKKKCELEIMSIRQKIMEHIDKIEAKLLLELSTAEDKITQSISAVLESLKEKEREVTECNAIMQDMKQFASDLQTFIGVKDIESRLSKHESFVEKMKHGKALDNINMEIIIDTKVKDILEEVKKFGSVHTSLTGSSISIVRRKDKQAQFVADKVRHVNDINVKNAQKVLQVDSSYAIRGADITPNGEVLFICHNEGRLVVVCADGSLKFCHSLGEGNYGFDVRCLDHRTAVYSSGSSRQSCLSMIDLTNRNILNTISMKDWTYGLAVTEESLIVAVQGIGIQSVDRSNFHISTILSRDLRDTMYVAACDGHVYFTDQEQSNKVTCCDMKGQIIWEFGNKNVLDYPNGVAVDNLKNVYVAGEHSKNVIVISPDGVQYKQVLTERDDVTRPTGLCFDRQRNRLLVANLEDAAYLYDII